jgi:ribosome recycling factor
VKTQKDDNEISEDEQKKFEKDIQEKVYTANRKVIEMVKIKEADIMKV